MADNTPIGKVSSLTGTATALSVNGENRILAPEAPVFQDDTITTTDGSAVELLFEDGTIFSQGANSEMLLDEYLYNASAGTGELLFNLTKGSLRAVSGEIVKLNPEGFNVETPLSTVGIRGTTFFVILTPDGQVAGVEQMDPAHSVVIETEMGQMTILQAGDFVAVQLDGFLSDPSAFTPEFLESVRDSIPLQSDPPAPDGNDPGDGGTSADGELPGGGEEVPQEVLDDLTAALQQLQDADDTTEIQQALGEIADLTGDGETDTVEELSQILAGLEHLLGHFAPAGTGEIADDVLFGNAADPTLTSINWKALAVDSDGSDQVGNTSGYNLVQGSNGLDYPLDGTSDQDVVLLLNGNDRSSGGDSDDILFGGDGNDSLMGQNGDDIIYGGIGDDHLVGGGQADYLIGGTGADSFWVTNDDETFTIRDFDASEDSFKIHMAGPFAGVAQTLSGNIYDGTTAQGEIFYEISTGNLYYDNVAGTDKGTIVAHVENFLEVLASGDFDNGDMSIESTLP